jgi:hypothetical protein
VSPNLQTCTARLVSSAGQVQMSSQEQKRGLRSLSTVMAAYAAGGSAGNSAVLDDGGAGLTSFAWSDPKVNNPKGNFTTQRKLDVIGNDFVALDLGWVISYHVE